MRLSDINVPASIVFWARFLSPGKEHFLIKALNGDLSDFRRKELSQNEAINLYKSCDDYNNFLLK